LSAPRPSTLLEVRSGATLTLVVALLVVAGVLRRLPGLDDGPLFIDEGESAINALSILAEGAPRDSFLGLPLFENTLLAPWPESAEYEFRDLSYSRRGYGIYHGWLPLYAMAASLAAHGIRPTELVPDSAGLEEQVRRRIRALRLPSVAFAALFLVGLYWMGSAMYGVDAGLAALATGAFMPTCVWIAQQGRYHSAALALTVLGAWATWRALRAGRWQDFALAGVLAGLLFHTSSLALAFLASGCLPLALGALRRPGGPAKAALLVLVFATLVVPWMLLTEYVGAVSLLPMARDLLAFPGDYIAYAASRPHRLVAGTVAVALVCGLWLARRHLPQRVAVPVAAVASPVLFCTGWICAIYVGFHLLTPAPSFWMERLSYALLPALIALAACGIAAGARVIAPRHSATLALTGTLALLFASGNALHRQQRDPSEATAVVEAARYLLEDVRCEGTRVYSSPSQHFCLTYFTGIPVQTVLPVRRSFFETHPGEIVILETVHRPPKPPRAWVSELLSQHALELTRFERERIVDHHYVNLVRRAVKPRVREVAPVPALPEGSDSILLALEHKLRETHYGERPFPSGNPAMLGGRPPLIAADLLPLLFYRFVQPEERTGERLNYAGRTRAATAKVLRSGWVAMHCPTLADRITESSR
jgi:hypothetical protein